MSTESGNLSAGADNGTASSRDAAVQRCPPYKPTVLDVLVVRAMLNARLPLPPELIDTIVEQAEYWAVTQTETPYGRSPERQIQIYGDSFRNTNSENRFLARSLPIGFPRCTEADIESYTTRFQEPLHLEKEHEPNDFQKWIGSPTPALKSPCRKVVFTIRSHDQGWGGRPGDHDTHNHSWTWFSAGLERYDAGREASPSALDLSTAALRPIYPPVMLDLNSSQPRYIYGHALLPVEDRQIQNNVVANRETREYVVEWACTDNIDPQSAASDDLVTAGRGRATGTGEFVRNLKLGDVITVWGHARFPGWMNVVEMVRIEVYWAV